MLKRFIAKACLSLLDKRLYIPLLVQVQV